MNWNTETATGREKLLILERKLCALYKMEPDLMGDKPYSFFPYMSEDCVLRSEKLPQPLKGQAIRDFLIREKRACMGFGPIPGTTIVEGTEDGEYYLRIRPRITDEAPDGELVQLELNADGQVCAINRFDENRVQYREMGSCVTLTPVRKIREGESFRYERNNAETVTISSLYYDEMTLIFNIVPECPVFTDMEERNMEISDWTAILNKWKEINDTEDEQALHDLVFRTEEKYVRDNKRYAEELEELIRDVAEKREPYGRRMQTWLEDWLNHCMKDHDHIRKC